MVGKARKGKTQTRRMTKPATGGRSKAALRASAARRSYTADQELEPVDEMDVSFTGLLDEADQFAQDAVMSGQNTHTAEAEAAVAFDGAWYLAIYPDVKEAGIEPVAHFLEHGLQEGRNPNPYFDGRAYVHANPDIAAFPFGPFMHYVCFGFREKRPLR